MSDAPELSLVTPARDEAASLPALHARIVAALAGVAWEWVIADDASSDDTPAVALAIGGADARVRHLPLSPRGGSHRAMLAGMAVARGGAVLVLAADLQDPPELAPALLARWREGADVVWAVRAARREESLRARLLARAYHGLSRARGARRLPPGGAGCCLLDGRLARALVARRPPVVDVFVAAARLARTTASVPYHRDRRLHGESRWSGTDKLRFALRSLASR